MKTIYSTTVEIPTELCKFRRTFWFDSVEKRTAFVDIMKERYEAERVATNLDHLMTVNEAVAEIEKELALRADLAAGMGR